jgi:uncharacterized protein RhaS with RHS repeats
MGARYYDPGTGWFLSPDPLGHDASLSLYDYAGGDPVNQLDPDGRCVKGLFGGAVKGDYYKPENTAQAVGQFLGQVGVGFTPAGILADIRDLSAAYRDIQNDGLSWGSGTNLALGAVAVIPGVGDVVKGAGKLILRTFTKNAQEIRAIDRAAVLSDAPTVHLSELGNAAEGLPQGPILNSAEINFSQRTVSSNVAQYADDMANGAWDWSRSGPLRVMEREGKWVSYDNRRLMGAQQAGANVPVQIVQPGELMRPGVTWEEAFQARFADPRNVSAGGVVPNGGLSTQPTIAPRR